MSEKGNCMPEKKFCLPKSNFCMPRLNKKHNPKIKFAFVKKVLHAGTMLS
jgi:hypothetical protein